MTEGKSAMASLGAAAAIGDTPLVQLTRLSASTGADIYVKLEFLNPSGSVKDRSAFAVIQDARVRGLLQDGGTIVEPTSGNMGYALAMVGAALGYRVVIVIPSDASEENKKRLATFGAEIVESSPVKGMAGAVELAASLLVDNPEFFLVDQFVNRAGVTAHREGTGKEILSQMAGRRIDIFVAGVGTGATLTGVAEALRAQQRETRIVAVEPSGSPILSQGIAGPHRIAGIGADFQPAILDRSLIDEVVAVTDDEAYRCAASLAQQEGLFVGPSSGANVAAALELGNRVGPGANIVTLLCDSGDRYIRSFL